MNINPTKSITIADNWQSIYQFTDFGALKIVKITIPATHGNPPTDAFSFVLWQGSDYDTANALNNGLGYGNSDLISAITAYLNKLKI